MSDAKFKLFLNKVCKVWTKDGFFRQGKIVEVAEESLVIDDRKDGLTYLNDDMIKNINEVRE
jgi:hypothetical protein